MIYPIAKKIDHLLELHDHIRVDPYFWLRDRENPEVIAYLNAENEYTAHMLSETNVLQKKLYDEMRARIKEDDSSAPYLKNGFWYYTRYEEGLEHPIYCRKKEYLDGVEEILMDGNSEAKEYSYYEIVSYSISRDNKLFAFTEDITGRRQYQMRIKNLETGEILPHTILNCGGDLAWLNDNETLFYSVKDEETLRPYLIKELNIHSGKSRNIYEEKDDTFVVDVNKSGDFGFIFIGSYSTLTTEFRFKSAHDATNFELFLPRKENHEYYPETSGNGFYIKTNLSAKNFKIVHSTVTERKPKDWHEIQPHNPSILIEDFEVFDTHLVVQEKENGLTRLRVFDKKDYSSKIIPPTEETYTLELGENPETSSTLLRINYSSLTTPKSIYAIDLKTFETKLIKQQVVIGEFDSSLYESKRIWAPTNDAVKVPISLVYKKETFKKDGTNPVLLYAYGSYGATIDPYFSSVRLSLLDRGFVFAIAHIRGSEYLGTAWYESGKLLKKKNTFTDYIFAAEFLISGKYVDPKQVFAMGGSAGGLLMGAVANLRPDLWKGIVSQVPFVDVVSTMIDETIPLTTGEYDEWGNPNEKAYYDYMLSYSPYDNIEAKDYPAMLITSGLHDSQVQYWEPTKYVAKLRATKTDAHPILLFTNMNAGHGGSAGRFEQLKEVAMEYAFMLWIQNKK